MKPYKIGSKITKENKKERPTVCQSKEKICEETRHYQIVQFQKQKMISVNVYTNPKCNSNEVEQILNQNANHTSNVQRIHFMGDQNDFHKSQQPKTPQAAQFKQTPKY